MIFVGSQTLHLFCGLQLQWLHVHTEIEVFKQNMDGKINIILVLLFTLLVIISTTSESFIQVVNKYTVHDNMRCTNELPLEFSQVSILDCGRQARRVNASGYNFQEGLLRCVLVDDGSPMVADSRTSCVLLRKTIVKQAQTVITGNHNCVHLQSSLLSSLSSHCTYYICNY